MNTLVVNGDGLIWILLLLFFLAFGVPIILFIIGLALRNKNKKASKALLIIATVYALIGLGICGSSMI
ncbi:hypothetical protein [Flavivirga rizhaonensis]|uniref:Uncharacterized protein n=1 Tax=Flavivirga rizhaonensis TaxID=2559571 RepID=A0A4S1DRI2_9FLAO|nr:hypothetical protein [Flavivirga rizhaonensis]TGV00546.1 hypothetical protein EM932_19285 [Flavivirga rizhaonensis]